MMNPDAKISVIENVIQAVRDRLPRNMRIRRNLPKEGRLRVDGQLPFLLVYRQPVDHQDRGTRELVTTEAAYLAVPGDPGYLPALLELFDVLSSLMIEHFGVYLMIEVWSEPALRVGENPFQPHFEIQAAESKVITPVVEALRSALAKISIGYQSATVQVTDRDEISPPGMSPLSVQKPAWQAGCYRIGVAVAPIYFNEANNTVFPILLQQLRRQFSHACRSAISAFGHLNHNAPAAAFESFGPASMVKAVREADQELNDVAEAFDFLLQVTPMNSDQAWTEFSAGGCRERPTLYYRPLPEDPSLLKRRLFQIPLERIEDPTLTFLLAEKQMELDRQLSALRDLDTPAFLQDSLQLYGGVDHELLELANAILAVPASEEEECETNTSGCLNAVEVARAARQEIDYYHELVPGFHATVELSDQITAGLMVSRDRLLISNQLTLRTERLLPLLQHEVGTHLVTWFNGRQQPFRQLSTGMAGYETLQEGLAVLSEYLAGGLNRPRMRTLAARVLAVWSLLRGDGFMETFRLLLDGHKLSPRSAFTTTLRVHRGGGLTKDVVYLRGLQDLLIYLKSGHEIEPLYVGKIALEHVMFMQELRLRGILHPPAVLPRFWNDPTLRQRLEECRTLSVMDLLERSP